MTRTYVIVQPHWYHSRQIGPIVVLDGYTGCLTCWSGPYAFAPVPFAPADWTQPSWAFDVEMLFATMLLLALVLWLGIWLGRRWTS